MVSFKSHSNYAVYFYLIFKTFRILAHVSYSSGYLLLSSVIALNWWFDSHFARAAENLLLRVQKEYLRPQQELAELKKNASQLLSKHSSRLQDAQDLVKDALANINETNRLFPLISSNLGELNVRLDNLHCYARNIKCEIVFISFFFDFHKNVHI